MQTALSSLTPTLAALAAVLGLILVAGRVLRATGLGRTLVTEPVTGAPRLVILDTMTLDRSRRLHVIRWDGHDLILLTGGTTDQLVSWGRTGDGA